METYSNLIKLILQDGATGLLLISLIFLVRHHLNVLKEHKVESDYWKKEQAELEKQLRSKIEDLLKDQIAATKPLTEALLESGRSIDNLKERDERIIEALEKIKE